MGLSKYWSHLAALLFVASILMEFAAVWGVPEEIAKLTTMSMIRMVMTIKLMQW